MDIFFAELCITFFTFEPVHPKRANGNCFGGVTIKSTLLTADPPLPPGHASMHDSVVSVPGLACILSTVSLSIFVSTWNIQKQWSRLSMWPPCLMKRKNAAKCCLQNSLRGILPSHSSAENLCHCSKCFLDWLMLSTEFLYTNNNKFMAVNKTTNSNIYYTVPKSADPTIYCWEKMCPWTATLLAYGTTTLLT